MSHPVKFHVPVCRAEDESAEYRLSPPMQEMVVSFLTRMAFLTSEGTKDPDVAALFQHTLRLLSQARMLWPSAPLKLHYMDKLLAANTAANLDPPPALLTGDSAYGPVFVQMYSSQVCLQGPGVASLRSSSSALDNIQSTTKGKPFLTSWATTSLRTLCTGCYDMMHAWLTRGICPEQPVYNYQVAIFVII